LRCAGFAETGDWPWSFPARAFKSWALEAMAAPTNDLAELLGAGGLGRRKKGGGKATNSPHPSPNGGKTFANGTLAAMAGSTFAAAEAAAAAHPGPKQPLDLRHERLCGSVIGYYAQNGGGFVRSHLFEGDLCFRVDRIMPEYQGHAFQENEPAEFDVQTDDTGRPHAVMLKPLLGRRPCDCLGQRHRGYVRRFAERWGFLNAAAFDGDLFVHRDNLLPMPGQFADGQAVLRAAQAVEFDVALDDRGRAVAKQIATRPMLRPCDWVNQRLRGFIRSFQGAWGFINSDRFAGDLFVHRDSLLGQYEGVQLSVGTIVEFDVERDHHRKGVKNRLVARNVAVLGGGEAAEATPMTNYAQALPAQLPMQHPQQSMAIDPTYGALSTAHQPQPISAAYGALNPQATTFASSQPAAQVYYQQQGSMAPALSQDLAQLGAAGSYGAPQYQYVQQQQYMQQPVLPQQPVMQQPVMQQPYAQAPYSAPYAQPPMPAQSQVLGMPTMQMPPAQVAAPPGAYQMTSPVQLPEDQRAAIMHQGQGQMVMAGAAGEIPKDEQSGLHIAVHDWEPDQPGQLWVTKGTLVNVSYRAAHGWVYAGSITPGDERSEPTSEGWMPQAVVKRVSLFRVAIDWPAEGSGTLGVAKGEVVAVSKQAERGWVYGERIGPRQSDRPADGWLPRKVLDYLQG